MTANDHRSANPGHHDSPTTAGDMNHAGADHTGTGALVPITVWRLDDRDDAQSASDDRATFASRLARQLIWTYTRRGDTVVDFDADRRLRDAATVTARVYLAITNPSQLADLAIAQPVGLIIVRWPRRAATRAATSVVDLFTACRLMMSGETCTIAAVSSADPGQPGTTYDEHLRTLLPAAQAAGLTHVLHIVAVSGRDSGDQFLFYATRAEADAVHHGGQAVTDAPGFHIDLLVFTTRQRRDD